MENMKKKYAVIDNFYQCKIKEKTIFKQQFIPYTSHGRNSANEIECDNFLTYPQPKFWLWDRTLYKINGNKNTI